MRTIIAIYLAVMISDCIASDRNLFVGVFDSETRENYGTDALGEYRIEVVAGSDDRYVATVYRRGKILYKQDLYRCTEKHTDYPTGRAPGRVEILCADIKGGSSSPILTYAENGISTRVVKPKYVANPQLVKEEGLKPGDPRIFEQRHFKTKYYAQIQWLFYGFRKVSP